LVKRVRDTKRRGKSLSAKKDGVWRDWLSVRLDATILQKAAILAVGKATGESPCWRCAIKKASSKQSPSPNREDEKSPATCMGRVRNAAVDPGRIKHETDDEEKSIYKEKK